MKTFLFSLGLFLPLSLLFVNPSKAQTSPGEKPVKSGNEWKMPGDVIQRSRAFADTLQQKLGCSDQQRQKLFAAFMANTKSLDELQVEPMSAEMRRAKLKANLAAFNETVSRILSQEQFKGYLKWSATQKF